MVTTFIKHLASNATVPNIDLFILRNINLDSHPAEWFNIFFPKLRTKNTHTKAVTIEEFQSWTNTKAMMSNSGRGGVSIRDSNISRGKK